MEHSVFWILILAAKFSFSFYFQIMPRGEPMKAIWKLKRIDYDWLELFGINNRLAVRLLWLPVLLICLVDIQRWDSRVNDPINLESRRRVAFFSKSLFVNIPHAPQVEKMMAFSVLTPYYNKEVLYNKEQLRTESEDGVSTLFYRQKIDDDEWINFLERMLERGMVYENEIGNNKLKDLRFGHRMETDIARIYKRHDVLP
ncbi:hypothetical protein IFM89_015597 [Coptis chinensis]|uniref:Glycosyl transferase 48 domain-containing protein n=1 Tax=Coptis chinensis TaxID=261450 RepID=A0A835I498_9MAGN|nr:hypothetical protein IFM89_015597 [Coptis chinensis]